MTTSAPNAASMAATVLLRRARTSCSPYVAIVRAVSSVAASIAGSFLPPPTSSGMLTPKAFASSTTMTRSGMVVPFSQRDTVRADTPSRSASASCVTYCSQRS